MFLQVARFDTNDSCNIARGVFCFGISTWLVKERNNRGGISSGVRRYFEVNSWHFAILMNVTAVRQRGVL